VVRGNLGISLRTGQRVTSELATALAYTAPVVCIALLIILPLTVLLAQNLAAQPWWGPAVRILLVNLQALPLFVVALVLLLTMANPEAFDWFPAYGFNQQPASEVGRWRWLGSYLHHAALPVVSLVITALPATTLQLEASLATELALPYIVTARAKGLTVQQLIRGHALRNAILPLLTQFTELLPTLVAGAVVVEMVFAVPGMGRLLAHAATTRDYPLLIGGVLLIGAARLLALLLADLLYNLADPRIR
jgi:peptide/nickel transport system permease protein